MARRSIARAYGCVNIRAAVVIDKSDKPVGANRKRLPVQRYTELFSGICRSQADTLSRKLHCYINYPDRYWQVQVDGLYPVLTDETALLT